VADVRVRRVEFEGPGAAGQPVPVDVVVNNNETVALAWNGKTCDTDGVTNARGHKTDVTLTVRDASGEEVYEETTRECVPVNEPSTALSGNARVSFRPELPAGDYTVEATVSVINEDRSHSGSTRSLTVEESTGALPDGDDPGGSNPWGGGGDDQSEDGPENGGGDPFGQFFGDVGNSQVILAIAALALVAWLANSASNTAEAFT